MASETIPVPANSSKGAHVTRMSNYKTLYDKSIKDPEGFFGKEAQDRLTWMRPFDRVLGGGFEEGDTWWFEGGRLNVSANCLDRHPPEDLAIIWEGDHPTDVRRITYGEALHETCRMANALIAAGVRKGDRVAIYMPMVPEAAYAMLACTRIGAVHSVVFAGFSAEALNARIQDATCKVVITADQGLRGNKVIPLKETVDAALQHDCAFVTTVFVYKRTGKPVPFHEPRDVWMHEAMARERPVCPPAECDAEDPLFLLYTSGSTGKPKGCIVPSSGLYTHFQWAIDVQRLTPEDVFILKTTATFDVSIHEMWVPLLIGCTSVVLADGGQLDFETVHFTMARGKVTFAHFVPSVLALFLDFVSPGDLPDLRQVVCIGEALLLSHRAKMTAAFGRPVQLINMYGPTEASVVVTYFDALDDMPGLTHGFPIGYAPNEDVKLYVTDPSDPSKLVPQGEKGEICIGGVQVAYGYLGRPELTAEKFVPNPHGEPGLMYRTGDLGSVDADGRFEYNGRADRQVKIGGVRMELGEIEAVCLRLFPQLLNVAVEKVDDKLVGVAAPVPGQELPSPAELSLLLAEKLPSPYIPAEWHFRDALPLGSAGKVDHNKVVAWINDQHKASMWGSIYDEMYFADDFQVADIAGNDPTMDWASYYDSFTGKMHERPTIEEWVQVTVEEVLERKPTAIIEMGCGKGMIIFRTAASPLVTKAIGADLSRLAIEHVERTWKSHFAQTNVGPAGLGKLSTYVRDASNFAGFPDASFSAVVINGVSLYFPSAAYQIDVLLNGLAKLQPGGCFHLGDVRSLVHQRLFCVRKARHLGASFEEVQGQAAQEALVLKDKDRSYHHHLFYALHLRGALPGVCAVEVQLKRGAIMSEFTRYRYNVLLHVGKPVKPLPVVCVPEGTAASEDPTAIAAAVAAEAGRHPGAVVACHGIANARLTADKLLATGAADAAAPAVQVGVGEGGGVDPAALREALASALPAHHVLLTWARSGAEERMDCYAMPKDRVPAGLNGAMLSACEGLVEELKDPAANVEQWINRTEAMDEDKHKGGAADDVLAAKEAKQRWARGDRRNAVLGLLAAKLGLPADQPVPEAATFSSFGGNSFVAMGCIGAMKEAFQVTMPVFELLTASLGSFADAVVKKSHATHSAEGRWLEESKAVDGSIRSVSDAHAPAIPCVVFFPMAGGSPKQFAHVYLRLREYAPHAHFLFVQPPGRDARAAEDNERSVEGYVRHAADALEHKLCGREAPTGPVVFVGDSWGALGAYLVAHELHKRRGVCPAHVVVSGNASPEVAATHMGLGCYSDKRMAELSDADLEAFLKASGVDGAQLAAGDSAAGGAGGAKAMLDALRADCELYEAFRRDPALPQLPCSATVLRGKEDRVVAPMEQRGWADEFSGEEVSFVTVPGASHHLYAEQPEAVAQRLARLLGATERHSVRLSQVRGASAHTWSAVRRDAGVLEKMLGAPCSFVKTVDLDELATFRAGYFRYRCGSPWGSRGELSHLAPAK
mmetsp:Transcript_3085/g.10153  ORF Transcript_3085/g.10153 Transcript_3085/m.10153 type:complete len:1502 (-) Transcript_3085:463-4968(-)